MSTYRKSVPKPATEDAGSPSNKKGEINVIYADDILTFPNRDADGVKLVGNILLKAGKKAYKLYTTSTTQKFSQEIEGDHDMEGFIKKFEAIHPGDSLAINEFVQNNIGVDVVVIFGEGCGGAKGRVLGSVCNPMRLKGSSENGKDGRKHTLMYEQLQKDTSVAGFYNGTIPTGTNFVATSTALAFKKTNGVVYEIPSLSTTAAITAASIDLDGGTIVTLSGKGGTAPATLTLGTTGKVVTILEGGKQWTALDGASIDLEVIDGGTVKYLKEVSRK